MESVQVAIAAVKAQNELLDMELSILRNQIERIDQLIARAKSLREEIEAPKTQEAA